MRARVFWSVFILALLASGCVTEFKANLPSGDQQILIVDGSIMGDSTVIFQLSKSYSVDSTLAPPDVFNIDATITIIGNNGYESTPATPLGNGAYSINTGTLDDNVEYGIKIIYNGDTYQSALSKPLLTPEIDSLSWVQPEINGPVGICVSTHDNNTNEPEFFLWDYVEDWEINASYPTSAFFNPEDSTFYSDFSEPFYHCWKHNVSSNYIVGSTESLKENQIINKQFYQAELLDRFTVLYCITVNQKTISKSAYDYYQNRIQLNEEMGGLFTPQPSNLDGNISCTTNPSKRAIGYVGVTKNTTHKRLFVYPQQISHPYNDCGVISQEDVNAYLTQIGITYADYYKLGYRPAFSLNSLTFFPDYWALSPCTNCTYNGGSKVKPDFWPNDDQ